MVQHVHMLHTMVISNTLQWARANGCPWDASTCSNAARGGHLDVLQWA
jgi:hypothetical protein